MGRPWNIWDDVSLTNTGPIDHVSLFIYFSGVIFVFVCQKNCWGWGVFFIVFMWGEAPSLIRYFIYYCCMDHCQYRSSTEQILFFIVCVSCNRSPVIVPIWATSFPPNYFPTCPPPNKVNNGLKFYEPKEI